jgi:diguanylate cyclase (GGDEF)-like protein/putative nucleotidyltransferase with HDIG domain
VCLCALVALFLDFRSWQPQFSLQYLVYLGIALAGSGMKVLPPGVNGNISVNYVFVLLALLEFPVPVTIILAVAGGIAQTFWNAKRRPQMIHLVFNVACIILTVSASAFVYAQPWTFGASPAQAQLFRLVLAGIVYFVVNILSLSIVIALSERKRLRAVWGGFYNWLFAYYLVGVSLAEMVHYSILHLGWLFAFALMPLLYVIYRSYVAYFGRLEQEKNHAENVASLHLRTIEGLAMAIEAKDECTAEHLRRVQVYSVQVAERLGLSEEDMQALRAASILHDIGKLAVPDYIISKPGKLTPEEFEKMKIHTIVGGAILEQVGFPYAVPPIVRSHHERWDGSGYPDGLKGEQIPIGARVLGAVDCLDALASERQYRRALPLDEAMDYVASLSGKSFDPRVVEILKANYREFEQKVQKTPLRQHHHRVEQDHNVVHGDAPGAGFEKNQTADPTGQNRHRDFMTSIASARHEVQTIFELTHDLSGSLRLEDTLSMFASRLKQIVPFDCIAIYIQEGSVLKAKYVNGENSRVFASLEIPVGQGLSGWVVENQKPVVNGNPSVEPAYLNDPSKFSLLNSALSVPLGEGTDGLSGALSLYRSDKDAFDRDHLRILLAVTGKISRAVERAMQYQRAEHRANTDALTDLPNGQALFMYLQDEMSRCQARNSSVALLVCDLDDFKLVNDRHGHLAGNELLKRVANILRDNCRASDYVARMGGDEFIVLRPNEQMETLSEWIERVDYLIGQAGQEICGEPSLGMSVGVACYPEDATDGASLINRADNDMYRRKSIRKSGLREVPVVDNPFEQLV